MGIFSFFRKKEPEEVKYEELETWLNSKREKASEKRERKRQKTCSIGGNERIAK